MTYRVLTPIYFPKPGHVPPPGQRCAPEHEMAPDVGTVVDLSHLSDVAREFYLRNGCIEPAAAATVAISDTDEGGK